MTRSQRVWGVVLVLAILGVVAFYSTFTSHNGRTLGAQNWSAQDEHKLIRDHSSLPTDSPPPEPIGTIAICAEKCKHIKSMCSDEFQAKISFPAPTCLAYSTLAADDPYYGRSKVAETVERNTATRKLIAWGGRQARHRRSSSQAVVNTTGCETVPAAHDAPMMWPEEFELIVKTMIQHEPNTYLEWGSGKSTSFYPLLASGAVSVIDGYPPWCRKVEEDPTVMCMVDEGRLRFFCKPPVRKDGSTIAVLGEGRLPDNIADADTAIIADLYVNAVDSIGTTHFDAALVDGRFRVACALKLLPYLSQTSVLFMHDFWLRPRYHAVLDYYNVVGYARSAVVLRKKASLPEDHATAYTRFMGRKHMI
eukprot:m.205950 g.205950  ORF g.205950 m.205950 type:complete len:364 (+) comp23142_c0_seq1:78-1169(+)